MKRKAKLRADYEDACTEHIIDNDAEKSGQAVLPTVQTSR